ncbi:NeuD/PglB/VioB family sugar acetyltransferase [Rhizobacter sp. AJA081-3]|uniref:NeuD/PglB/VioB family sugar acetyltransferase n=1 Tax=Rhizobacter sp. AJA081-3 TaxID=2753607 RepID=UPI001ADED9F7|nr:NeuD/PglB/VioB family sugar acetyltransferase [Rhizobacter sp. AJA081-3]QTN24267.1 NeuD/PglB/VioB family sugar acetyltransferase [Rhizobacter sp. AJA081-3]
MPRGPAILLGAGGHAKVVLALAQLLGWQVVGVSDPAIAAQGLLNWRGLPVLDDQRLAGMAPGSVELLNGVGQTTGGGVRQRLFDAFTLRGFRFPALVHPAAIVDPSARVADGVQVMAGAVIQADTQIGANSIVNTRAGIDHDATLGAHVHVAPGATLCGSVQLGDGAFVGAGATVVQGVRLGRGAFLAAGALLARDLPDAGRWPERSAARAAAS